MQWDVAPMITARGGHAVAAVGGSLLSAGHLYAVGGHDGNNVLSTVECFNTATNVGKAVAPLITARDSHGVAAVGGHLYAVGGLDDEDNVLPSVECYNPATNVWTAVAHLITARNSHNVCFLKACEPFLFLCNAGEVY